MDTILKATHVSGKAADITQQLLQTSTANVPGAAKNASETVGKTAGALGDIFKDITRSSGGK